MLESVLSIRLAIVRHIKPKWSLQKAKSNFAKISSLLSGKISPIASISWLMQVLHFGKHDCMLSLKHTEGWMAKPKTGSSSQQVANFSILLSNTGSRLPAVIRKTDKNCRRTKYRDNVRVLYLQLLSDNLRKSCMLSLPSIVC